MRHLLTGMVVAAAAAVAPALASAGNQDVADQIAKKLRTSGQLDGYTIAVKYKDGTTWLQGRVRSQQQMHTALKMVFQTPGVSRVVNDLTVGPSQPANPPADSMLRFGKVKSNLAGRAATVGGPVQRVPSSFNQVPVKKVSSVEPQLAPPGVGSRAVNLRVPERPVPIAFTQAAAPPAVQAAGGPIPAYVSRAGGDVAPARYDQPHMPNYSWPSYAAYPNYAAVTYPRQYSPTAWPFIGPFYPYPQVPLGWRKVTLQWDDGWWFLDFKDSPRSGCWCD